MAEKTGFTDPSCPLKSWWSPSPMPPLRNCGIEFAIGLVEAAAFFRGEGCKDAFLKGLGEAFPQALWFEKAKMLEQASLFMDEAAIHTIHGWSNRMLRQYAFECGSPFDLELASDDQELLEEAACDYWRSHFYPASP